EVVAAVTGAPLDAAVRRLVTGPLGMTVTGFGLNGPPSRFAAATCQTEVSAAGAALEDVVPADDLPGLGERPPADRPHERHLSSDPRARPDGSAGARPARRRPAACPAGSRHAADPARTTAWPPRCAWRGRRRPAGRGCPGRPARGRRARGGPRTGCGTSRPAGRTRGR